MLRVDRLLGIDKGKVNISPIGAHGVRQSLLATALREQFIKLAVDIRGSGGKRWLVGKHKLLGQR